MDRRISLLYNRVKNKREWKTVFTGLGSQWWKMQSWVFCIFLFLNISKNEKLKHWFCQTQKIISWNSKVVRLLQALFSSLSRRTFLYEWECATLKVIVMFLVIKSMYYILFAILYIVFIKFRGRWYFNPFYYIIIYELWKCP